MKALKLNWDSPVLIHNIPPMDFKLLTDNREPGLFGSEYPRMTGLSDGSRIIVYTLSDNPGYGTEPSGGKRLEFALSEDGGRKWSVLSRLSDEGRDLDNGQIIELSDGTLLMACRSVIWQQSYRLDVYESRDKGRTWDYRSTVDENHGAPGALGHPDKGVYEPHFYFLPDGRLSVMYANEIHVTEDTPYSQIISQRISTDGGLSWGKEIWVAWDPHDPAARPGMPVWDRMQDGRYIVVFEVCATHGSNVYYKISADGCTWEPGIGRAIVGQYGGPYVVSLSDGGLLVSSNSGHLSYSDDSGQNWLLMEKAAFPYHLWSSVYQTGEREIAVLNSMCRREGGHHIQIRFADIVE